MKALTITEPWASCILYHGKHVENRSWQLPVEQINKPIALHTSKKSSGMWFVSLEKGGLVVEQSLPLGHIVAIVHFTKCVKGEPEPPWLMPGLFHWHIKVDHILKTPIAAKGKLMLWQIPTETELEIYKEYEDPTLHSQRDISPARLPKCL